MTELQEIVEAIIEQQDILTARALSRVSGLSEGAISRLRSGSRNKAIPVNTWRALYRVASEPNRALLLSWLEGVATPTPKP